MMFQCTQEISFSTTLSWNLRQQQVAVTATLHHSHPSPSSPDTLLLPANIDGLQTQASRKQPS